MSVDPHQLKQAVEEARKRLGRLNLIVVGRTGVGKSTLINEIFQERLTRTAIGRPVTMKTEEFKKEGIPLSIYDTRGLEMSEYKKIIQELEGFIQKKQKSQDLAERMHMAWLCISAIPPRFEQAEIDAAEMLCKYVPVVAVLTLAYSDESEFREEVRDNLGERIKNVIPVLAMEKVLVVGKKTIKLEPTGLEDLIEITRLLVPEAVEGALIAVQKVSLEQKQKKAHAIVASAAGLAATAGAVPLAFADALLLVPIEVGMLAGISAVWGLDLTESFLATLVSSTFAGSLGTIGGRWIVDQLLKFIPGVSLISAGVAASLTTTFGEAYIATLSQLTKKDPGRTLTVEEITEEYKRQLNLGRR
jgi:uncharacterized protein (DUF697 family)/GTPase SAR1 family protein